MKSIFGLLFEISWALCPEIVFITQYVLFFRYSEKIAAADGGASRVIVYGSGFPEESGDNCKKPSLFTS